MMAGTGLISTPGRPERISVGDRNRVDVSVNECVNKSANGALRIPTTWQRQPGGEALDPSQVQPTKILRGRSMDKRGPNRSRSLCNKNKNKKDSMIQCDLSHWAHLFNPRRGRSLDSRVNPTGAIAISTPSSPNPSRVPFSPLPPVPPHTDAVYPNEKASCAQSHGSMPQVVNLDPNSLLDKLNEPSNSEAEQLEPWGDPFPIIEEGKVLRCIYQNIAHSLSTKGDDPSLPQLVANWRESQCGIAICSETNTNWRRHIYSQEVRRVIQQANTVHMSTTCSAMGNEPEFKRTRYLPGGAAIFTFNHWASIVEESGYDEYDCGWWCFTTLRGRNKRRLTIVGFYRSNKPTSHSGPTTAHAQVMRQMEAEKLAQQNPRKILVPREEMTRRVAQKLLVWQQRGDSLLFLGDGNETPADCLMQRGTKKYSMAWLFEETGMSNILHDFHAPPSTTTTTPGRPIDWIGAWRVPVLRVGRFDENYPAISDHLAFFLDIDIAGLMGGAYDEMKLPKLQKLTLDNIAARVQYEAFVLKQWQEHQIAERAQRLHDRALRGVFSASDQVAINALDRQITEILLGAERRCCKKNVERDKWSPRLKVGGRNILYWRARLHSLSAGYDSTCSSIERYRKRALISEEEHHTHLSRNAIKQKLREAWALHRAIQNQADECRQKHLELRADALAAQQNTQQAKAVRAIRHQEQTRQRFARIRRANGKMKRGLIQIEVKNPETGDLTMLTEKEAVNDALLARNELHLQEPNFTPFGTLGDLYHMVDPSNPNNQVEALLDGIARLPESRAQDTAVQQWVSNLQRKNIDELNLSVTSDDFVHYFSRRKESTASSPSERHYGHMKVIAKMEDSIVRDTLLQVAATAVITKQQLDRWLRCTQVMLDKGKGVFINNLRIVQLLEADLNFILGYIWSKRLNQAATNNALFNTSQYALPGKTCNSAVLKKVLFFDLVRQTQQAGSIVDFDAKAAYDSIIPALATVTCMRMELPRFAGEFMTQLINQMEYSVATGLGESTKTYKAGANPFMMCQGGMQGSTSAAPIYNVHHDVSLTTYCQHGTPAVFKHPNPDEGHTEDYAAQFVDDNQQQKSVLGMLRHYSADLAQCQSPQEVDALLIRVTNEDANRWCRYSFCAGGLINASKCFWQYIRPVQCPITGKISYRTAADCPGEVTLIQPDDPDLRDTIPRYEASVANRTLGARLAPDGNVRAEIQSRYEKAKQWSVSLRKSQLSNADCWVAYTSCVCPAVAYPLAGQQCSIDDLKHTQKLMDTTACHALGLNEHFPRALLHGPVTLGGIGVSTLWATALAEKLSYFVHHMRVLDDVGRQLKVSTAITQLEVGCGTPFFDLPFETWGHLVTKSWVTHLWDSCSRTGINVRAAAGKHWIPPLQTEMDDYIMDRIMRRFSRKASIKLNHCRRYLQVLTTSDLFLHDGMRIHPDIYRGKRASGRRAQYDWPDISPPSKSCWAAWKHFLNSEFPDGSQPNATIDTWNRLPRYSHELLFCYDMESRSLFCRVDAGWRKHDQLCAPTLRGIIAKFHLDGTQVAYAPPDSSVWVEVEITKVAIVVLSESLRVAAAMRQLEGTEDPMEGVLDSVCLKHRLKALPPELRRLVGNVTLPEDDGEAILAAIRKGERVFGVSDGSASKGVATHGWKLARLPRDPLAISGSGPVDGFRPNSFRAEMQGQLAVLIVTSLLVAARGIRKARIISLCDNKATLRRLAAHSRTLRVKDQMGSEVDLFLIYREWMRMAHVQCHHQWVKGHQDRKLPLHEISDEGRLNIEVDALATSAYTQSEMSRSDLSAAVYAEEAYGIFIDGGKVTSNLKQRVLDRCGEDALRQYLYHKYALSEGKLDCINWTALARYLKSLSAPRRATQVKLQHAWIPTNAFLFCQKRVPSDKCPLCESAVETAAHVRCCVAPVASRFRRDRLAQMLRELKGINTAPEIVQCWHSRVAELCGEPTEDDGGILLPRSDLHKALGVARRHQSVLSWEGFLQGRVSSKWLDVQACHERRRRQETASCRNKDSWDVQAMRIVCEFHADLWAFRNDEVHGRTKQEAQQKLRLEVEGKVKALYARHPVLLARYPSVYSMPLEVRLKKPTLVLQMWVKQVLQQEHLTDIARWRANMAAGSIDRFLRPRSDLHPSRDICGVQRQVLWNSAAVKIGRWIQQRARTRSNVELPRMGIGDPG